MFFMVKTIYSTSLAMEENMSIVVFPMFIIVLNLDVQDCP